MPRLARLVLCLFAATIVVPTGGALAASGPDPSVGTLGVRLVAPPGAPTSDPLARTYIIASVAPGARLTRDVEISNTTPETMPVLAYAAAASTNGGVFGFADGHTQNDVSSWTRVSRPSIDIAAGETVLENVTIRVPRNAAGGEHYAVIWAEASASAPSGGRVRLVNRVGIRVYLTVANGGAEAPMFTLSGLHADRSGGEAVIAAVVHNTGGSTLTATGDVTLADGPSGLRAGPFPITLRQPIAPGGSASVTAPIGSTLPVGPWRVRMVVRSGDLTRAITGTLTFPAAAADSPPPAGHGQPWTTAIGLLLLALLVVAGAAVLRRVRGARLATGL
jgi:hypothetical protein